MRKTFLLILLTGSMLKGFPQENLLQRIEDTSGISRPFAKLDSGTQISFNPHFARRIFGLHENSDLILTDSGTDNKQITYYRFYQTYENIPVENAMLIVHTRTGRLESSGGGIVTRFNSRMEQNTKASLTVSNAISAALAYVHAERYAWQDPDFEKQIKQIEGDAATFYPAPSLAWYSGTGQIDPRKLRLTFKVDVYSVKPLNRQNIYVDAENGNILGEESEMEFIDATGSAATGYSGTQTIHCDLFSTSPYTYRLRDYTKGNGIFTYRAQGATDYTNGSAAWNLTGVDKYALDAHFGMETTYSFYKTYFNRNSMDNLGLAINGYANDVNLHDNANWDGTSIHFGILSAYPNGGVSALDVCAHELTHGVTQYTSKLVSNALEEAAAINESMSDMMGKSVQFITKPADNSWVISNDLNYILRDMSNPKSQGQPNTYMKGPWYTGADPIQYVHTNCLVGDFMFYLLVNGGSGTNDVPNSYTVSGIGLAKADQIIYNTETQGLTPHSTYANWRTYCITAAQNLYGYYCNEVNQVENAWYAVGVGTAAPPPPPTCGTPYIGNVENLGGGVANLVWSTVNGAISYNIEFVNGTTTKLFSNFIPATNPNSGYGINFSGIPPGTYTVSVQANCSGGLTGPWYSFSRGVQISSIGNNLRSQTETIDSTGTLISGDFRLYPNPSSSQVNIYYNAQRNGRAEIEVLNEIGSKMMVKSVIALKGENSILINISSLTNGVYIVRLVDGNDIHVQKLMVQK